VCLKAGRGLWKGSRRPQKTHRHCSIPHFKPIFKPQSLETSKKMRGYGDFQQVLRAVEIRYFVADSLEMCDVAGGDWTDLW
jgi:hypothetical protein